MSRSRRLRVALVTETYAPNMGYLASSLSKYLSRLGVDVHVVALDLAPYYNISDAGQGPANFLKQQALAAGTVQSVDGYTVHILRHGMLFGYARSRGLAKKLHDLKPDIVYSVLTLGWNPLVALICKYLVGYKLFIGSHTAASVFPLARKSNSWWVLVKNFLSRWVSGRLVSLAAEKCYCPTHDCGEVAVQFFGVQLHKISIIHLGIDTEFFFPIADSLEASRQRLRQQLGFTNDEIVCIYTGKMSIFKNPLVLAQAIESLRSEGRPFRAIFIGDGSQRAAVAQASPDSALVDFMEFNKLGDYYRAADIAVWPTNESTSMLDAAACGLPLVVSDQIYQDHVQGNGMAYRMNDLESLVTVLRGLQDETVRRRLGAAGALKMRNSFTWESAARRRLRDFESSLNTPT